MQKEWGNSSAVPTLAEECSLSGQVPVRGDPVGNRDGVGDSDEPSVVANGSREGLEPTSPTESWDGLQHLA